MRVVLNFKPRALYRRLTAHVNNWIHVWDLVKTRRRARASASSAQEDTTAAAAAAAATTTTATTITTATTTTTITATAAATATATIPPALLVLLPVLSTDPQTVKISFTEGSARKPRARAAQGEHSKFDQCPIPVA